MSITTENTLATKSDLLATKSDLEHSINILRLEIKDVVIKLGGMMFLAVGVILTGIKYL